MGGAWCQALSLPRPPVLWSGQPGFRDPCVPGAVDAGVWTQHRPHSVRPCGPALFAVGVAEGRPRGGVPSTVVRGAWCQALSLPRPPVLRSVQPGFRDPRVPGAVGAGVGTQHRPHSVRPCGPALLAVGVAEGRPRGGVPSTGVGGAWCQALSLPRPPVLWSGQPGFRDPCVPGAVDAGVWTQHRPHSVRPCGPALLSVEVAAGRPRGGVPSTVVRGAWCQALSLPRPPVLRSVQPGFRDPCVAGAVDAGVWTQHRPHSVRPCGPTLLAVGMAEGRPRGGVPSTVVRGAWCQALSLPRPPVLRSVQPGFRDPRVPGAVGAGVGTQHRPHSVRPCGPVLLAVGVAEGRPRGGVPSTVVRGAWGQALSLPRPPVLRSVQPGFRDPCVPGAVDAGVGTQHWPHSVRPCGPALLAVGVVEGRPRGGVPSTVVRGAWCQALSLPRPPVLRSVQPGFRDPCVPGAVDAGVWTQHRPHSVRPCGPALLAVGVAEGRPLGGGAFHRCEGRLVSGAVPPPAARPPERAARVPRPACPGRGRCGRGDPAPAPQRAPLRAGVARCGGGGRASPGGGCLSPL